MQLQAGADAAAYYPYPGLTFRGGQPAGASDDNGDAYVGTGIAPAAGAGVRRVLRAERRVDVGRRMDPAAEGVALDRRGSGFSTDVNNALDRLFLTGGTSPGPATAALGVRARFPAAVNALLPIFQAPGFGFFDNDVDRPGPEVGYAQIARAWLGGTTVLQDRDPGGRECPADHFPGRRRPAERFAGDGGGRDRGRAAGGPRRRPRCTGPCWACRTAWRLRTRARWSPTTVGPAGYDAPYGPAETVALHLSDDDRRAAGAESRLLELVPASFVHSPDAAAVRKRYTSVSTTVTTSAGVYEPIHNAGGTDRRSPRGVGREWEYADPDTNTTTEVAPRTFPPTFGSVAAYAAEDPFRAEVRALLSYAARDAAAVDDPLTTNVDESAVAPRLLRRLIRQLSFNGVVERVTNPIDPLYDGTVDLDGDGNPDGLGELRIRPLTPHPAGLNADRVDPPGGHLGYTGTTFPRFGVIRRPTRRVAGRQPERRADDVGLPRGLDERHLARVAGVARPPRPPEPRPRYFSCCCTRWAGSARTRPTRTSPPTAPPTPRTRSANWPSSP